MAVFFRIKTIGNQAFLEIKIFGLTLRLDLLLDSNGIILITKSKKNRIFFNQNKSKTKRKENINLPNPSEYLCTFFKSGASLLVCIQNQIFYYSKAPSKIHLILFFDLIKNTCKSISEENGQKSPIILFLENISTCTSFKVKFHLKGIIFYLYQILKNNKEEKLWK